MTAPAWRIEWPGGGAGLDLRGRLTSLRLLDAEGEVSDSAEITFRAEDLRAELPSPGRLLRLHLGYPGRLKYFGEFILDSYRLSGPARTATLTAYGVDFTKGSLQSIRTASYPAGTFQDFAAALSRRHAFEISLSPHLAPRELPHIDQIRESDLALIKRIVSRFDAVVKFRPGEISIHRRGSEFDQDEVAPIEVGDIDSWSFTIATHPAYAQWKALWLDGASGKIESESAGAAGASGQGQTQRRLYPTRAAAQAVSEGSASAAARHHTTLNLRLPGNPDLVAEIPFRLTSPPHPPDIAGLWHTQTAIHTITPSGYQTQVTAHRPPPNSPRRDAP